MAKISKKSLEDIVKALNSVAGSSEKLNAVMEKQVKATNDVTKATTETAKASKEAESELKKLNNQVENAEEACTDAEKKMWALRKEALKLAKAAGFKTSAKIEVQGFGKIKSDLANYQNQLSEAKKQLSTFEQKGAPPEQLKAAQMVIKDLTQKLHNLGREMDTVGGKFEASLKVDKTPARAVGNIEESVTGIGSAFGALGKSPADFAEHMQRAKVAAEGLKDKSAIIGKMPGLLGAAGKAAGGLAGAFGGITKVLAGWPGLIASAVIGIAKAAIGIDSYIKDMNKRFAEIRGPDIMTKDLKKQFKAFNDSVMSAAANIRDGLNSEQVREFMAAIGTAGQRLTTLNEGFYSYRDAVHIAARASKVFGMDMSTVGALMGKLSTDYLMDIDKIDDAFVQVAFDAQKSGLSTDRFLSAVQNASVGLSFYGTFIKTASKMMSEFTKTQVMGADDAAAATQDITQAFGKMDVAEGAAFIALAGGTKKFGTVYASLQKEAREKAKALGEQAINVEAEMRAPGTTGEKREELAKKLEQIRTDQKKNRELTTRLQGASNADLMGMAANIGSLTDMAPKAILDLIGNVAHFGDITKLDGNRLVTAMIGVEKATNGKINAKLVQRLISQTRANGEAVGISLDYVEGFLKKTGKVSLKSLKQQLKQDTYFKKNSAIVDQVFKSIDENTSDTALEDKITELTSLGIKDARTTLSAKRDSEKMVESIKSLDENMNDLTKGDIENNLAKILDTTQETVKPLIDAASTNKGFRNDLANLVKQVTLGQVAPEQANKLLKDIMTSNKVALTYQQDQLTTDAVTGDKLKDAYDDSFREIKNQTLSLEEMIKAARDEVEYRFKSLNLFRNMSTGISAMADGYLKGYESKKMTEAVEKLKKEKGITLTKGKEKIIVEGKETDTTSYIKELLKQGKVAADAQNEAQEQLTLLDKLEKVEKQGKTMTEGQKKQLKDLKTHKADLDKQVADSTTLIEKNKSILGSLQEAGVADQDMINILEALASGSKMSKEALLDLARRKFPGMTKISLEQLKQTKGLGPFLAKAIETEMPERIASPEGAGKTALIKAGALKGKLNVDLSKGETEASAELLKQGLRKPEKVTREGAIYLHPGESIFPSSKFETMTMPKPNIMDEPARATAAPAERSIVITVNATEKDLAQRIANEVRGVLYKERVNNMG